jgi:hypothetical protein
MLFDIPAGVTHYMEGIWVHYFISFFSFKTTYWQRALLVSQVLRNKVN